MRNVAVLLLFALLLVIPLRAQSGSAGAGEEDPGSYIGLTLAELSELFGPPRLVYPVRGLEEWQDDVVFVYDRGDFYILKDRVWQAGLKAAVGIKAGDPAETVIRVMNSLPDSSGAERGGNSLFCSLTGKSWPLRLRCDFDGAGRVSAIFIYRSDL